VDGAVNKLLKKAQKAGRKLMRKLGIGKKKKGKDTRSKKEMEADLGKARKEVKLLLGKDVVKKKKFDKELKKIKKKYDLQKLEVVQKGKDYEIFGKINPEYRDYAEKVTVVSKETLEAQQESELETFFRAVSLKELAKLQRGENLKPRTHKDGSQKGEFGLTTNKEYTVNNIIYSDSNKNKRGKLRQADAAKANYVVLLEIRVKKGTQEMLKEKYGRKQSGEQENHALTEHLPVHGASEKNYITMKVERIKGGGENVNYMITSKSPDDLQPDDPLYDINASIVDIKIIGGIIDP
jgi:uncharacterized membrane-anchored protein YhcB (DUF1043 family)